MIKRLPTTETELSFDAKDIYFAQDPEMTSVENMAALAILIADPKRVSPILQEFIDDEKPDDSDEDKHRRGWAKSYVESIEGNDAPPINGIEYDNNLSSTKTTISRKFEAASHDGETSYHSMRQVDGEGMAHRLHYLDNDLGLMPDQVLSPRLGQSSHVEIIESGSKLIYDKAQRRLMPKANDGRADGWIIKNDNELADFLAFEGGVADCPMVTIEFYDVDTGAKVASSGSHAGWKNLRNGIDVSIGKAAEKANLTNTIPRITVGPGARTLALPDRVLDDGERTNDDLGDKPLTEYLADEPKIEMDGAPARVVDTVDLAGRLYANALGIQDYDEALENGQIVLSITNTLDTDEVHSYRMDGHWNPDSPTAKRRPEAGRHLQVTVPYYASSLDSVREEFFGDEGRGTEGILKTISDDEVNRVFVVS